jgi:hypothetical protein
MNEKIREHLGLSAEASDEQVVERIKMWGDTIAFYADPETYFAIGMFPDSPCGDFIDDFSKCAHPQGGIWEKPGKRARAAFDLE